MVEQYWWRNCPTILGLDVGKRVHPSHCSIFAVKEDDILKDKNNLPLQKMIMIHSKFMDNWEYTKQIQYLTVAVEYFNVQRGYYDNTRSELEERSLPRQIIPIKLSSSDGPVSKSKYGLATNFAKMVEQRRMELIDEDRFISQITCVTSDLEAASTPLGHGDSFISVCLAVGVFFDFYARDRKHGISTLGNIQEIFGSSENPTQRNDTQNSVILKTAKIPDNICKICGGKLVSLPDNRQRCERCMATYG